jgi:hypothetical protein
MLALTSAARAQSAAGPFAAVPNGSWEYAAVASLARAGYFTGYPAGTFEDGRVLTRLDFAVALQRMARRAERQFSASDAGGSAAGADAKDQAATLQRLLHEFSAEYAGLGEDSQQLSRRLELLADRLAQRRTAPTAPHPADDRLGSVAGGSLTKPRPLYSRMTLPWPSGALDDPIRRAGLLPPAATGPPLNAGPIGLSLGVVVPSRLNASEARVPLTNPQADTALDARLSLPLGRTLVSGFYKRVGEQFQSGDAWMPAGFRGTRGLAGFGGGVRAPLGRVLSLDLEGGTLRPPGTDASGDVLFLHSGVNVALGRAFSLDLGYERLQYGSHSLTADLAEQYNVGLGRAFGRNTRLELLYQFGSLRRGLDGDAGPGTDATSYSAVGQFRIRF